MDLVGAIQRLAAGSLGGHRAALVVATLLIAGCGPSYPPVSGRVTIAGRPAAGVRVLFTPLATGSSVAPGPYAQATTDAECRYSLVTRRGIPGATPGRNLVELKAAAWNELEYLRSEAARLRTEAGGGRSPQAARDRAAVEEQIGRLEASTQTDGIEPTATAEFLVPAEGHDAADFDLAELAGGTAGGAKP